MHPYIPELKEEFRRGRISRREFMRMAALLGLSPLVIRQFVAGVARAEQAQPMTPAAAASPKRGGVIRAAERVQRFDDPARLQWVPSSNVCRHIAEYLTFTDHENVTHPYLAERWEASADAKTWTFTLRKGVKFNTGKELTADDVIWNLKRWLDPKTGSSTRGLMSYLSPENIQKVDSHTVRLHLDRPQIGVPEHLYHYPALILPKEFEGDFTKQPWGTGPFLLAEYVVGERVVLKRRLDYWRAGADGKPLPYVDSVRVLDLGDEAAASVAALASGQVDVIPEVEIATLDALERMPHVEIARARTAQTAFFRMRVDKKPFDDVRVRTAIKLCQDRAKILRIAYRGFGDLGADHPVAPIHPAYCPEPAPAYDPARAKALLLEAGYPNGIDVTLTAQPEPQWEPTACQVLKETAAPAGIRISVNTIPSQQYWQQWTELDFGFTRWTHRPLETMVLALAFRCGEKWNETRWCSEQLERLLNEAEATVEVEKRRKLMCRIQTLIREEGAVGIPLWRNVFLAHDKKVKTVRAHPTRYMNYWTAWLEA